MSEKHDLLEPPESAIMTGYAMMRAHQSLQGTNDRRPEESDYYILQAIHCLPEALEDVNKVLKKAGKDEIFHHETGPAEDMLGKAFEMTVNVAAPYSVRYTAGGKVKTAHKYVSDLMATLGFREITDRDFARLGGGGGR